MSLSDTSSIERPVDTSAYPDCAFADAELFDYFLDLGEGHDNSRMRRHVFACARCRERLKEFQESERNVRRSPRAVSSAELTAGALGELTLVEILGQGGMGKVWKAYDAQLQRFLAVKVMHADLLELPELRERFVCEARMTARLNHPNIVHIYSSGKHSNTVYIAMELINGRSLKDLIKDRALNIAGCVDILRQILEGLAASHRERIVHRDIKPSNLIVDRQGRVRILDFGLAKELRTTDSPTLPGALLGTLAYMPPEALAGGSVSRQWDIYALGIVAYEMLTGSSPYAGASSPVTTQQLLKDKPLPRPSLRNSLVPPWLDEVVLKMCAPQSVRYANAEAVLCDLDVGTEVPASLPGAARIPALDDTAIELESIDDAPSPSMPATAPSQPFEELLLQDPAVGRCTPPLPVRARGLSERVALWLRRITRTED